MKFLFLFVFTLGFFSSFSQDKNSFYALDANMNATTMDSSKYILWIHQEKDTNWVWDYYRTWGPLIKSNSFADHDGTILNGKSYQYNTTGNIDSSGIFDHGKKNGSFYKYRTVTKDSIILLMQYDYTQDSLLKTINLQSDSIKNKANDTSGIESEFPGGIESWNSYLSKGIVYPQRAFSKEIQGQVAINFIVDTLGKVNDLFIVRSVEYSLDQEAIRVIQKSPAWIPAVQNGEKKKSYKYMPINFKLQ